MSETVTKTADGIIIIKTKTPDGAQKTTRYFDSSRQMILDTLEEFADKKILTKYKTDGYRIAAIEIQTETKTISYCSDGKTISSIKETLPDGSIQTTHFQGDGKTIDRIKHENITGSIFTTKYQADGITPALLIESDMDGLTRTTIYQSDGTSLQSLSEDLADGTTQKTIYQADGKTISVLELRHIKGIPANKIRRLVYDSSGKKVIETTEETVS